MMSIISTCSVLVNGVETEKIAEGRQTDLGGKMAAEWASKLWSPEVIAAIIAAVAAVAGLVVSWRTMIKQNQLQLELANKGEMSEERRKLRNDLREIVRLITEVLASISKLTESYARLENPQMVTETSHTLAIVSDLINHTPENKLVEFPEAVAKSLATLRNAITSYFLELKFSEEERNAPKADEKLLLQDGAVRKAAAVALASIRKFISPGLPPA